MINWFNRAGVFGVGTVFGIVLCIAILLFTDRYTVPQISVTVVNNAGFAIREIRINHQYGYLVHNGLAINNQITLPVSMPEAGGYSIKVEFENGTILEDGMDKLESGYSTTEVVLSDRIEARHVSAY